MSYKTGTGWQGLTETTVCFFFFQIADFGLSNLYQGDKFLQTYCGSPLYASPEIVNGRPYRGPEVDSWSLGVLLYTLVHGAMPFDGQDHKNLVQQISTGNYRKPTKPSGKALTKQKMQPKLKWPLLSTVWKSPYIWNETRNWFTMFVKGPNLVNQQYHVAVL